MQICSTPFGLVNEALTIKINCTQATEMKILITFASGVFALVGVALGVWLSRRTEYEKWRRKNQSETFSHFLKMLSDAQHQAINAFHDSSLSDQEQDIRVTEIYHPALEYGRVVRLYLSNTNRETFARLANEIWSEHAKRGHGDSRLDTIRKKADEIQDIFEAEMHADEAEMHADFNLRQIIMNGWHRLWILLTVIAAIVAGLAAALSISDISPRITESTLNFLPKETNSKLGFDLNKPYYIVEDQRVVIPPGYEKAMEQAAEGEALRYKIQIAAVAFGGWFVACTTVLALGHGVAWVIRGFKRKNA